MGMTAVAVREHETPSICLQPEVPMHDIQLLAHVLSDAGTGGEDALVLATAILHGCGGVGNLVLASRAQLMAAGLSTSQAERIRDCVALAVRVSAGPRPTRPLDRPATVALLRPELSLLGHEEMHVLFVGADGTFRGRQRVAVGGFSAVVAHPRDILAPVVEAQASALVIAHNHPSGHCAPSPEDVSLSERVERGAAVLGLRLLDHLVFARDGVASAMPDGARWPGPASGQRHM